MKYNNSLLTSFLDDCNIQYQIDDDNMVWFNYRNRYLFGRIYDPEVEGEDDDFGFVSALLLGLPAIYNVPPFDVKQYLKLINKLNDNTPVVTFVLCESDNNRIDILSAIPLDSTPEIEDIIPGLVNLLVAAHNKFNEAAGIR